MFKVELGRMFWEVKKYSPKLQQTNIISFIKIEKLSVWNIVCILNISSVKGDFGNKNIYKSWSGADGWKLKTGYLGAKLVSPNRVCSLSFLSWIVVALYWLSPYVGIAKKNNLNWRQIFP